MKISKTIIVLALIMAVISAPVYATPGYDPGVKGDPTTKKGEYRYTEVIFLTGEPISMDGTVTVTDDPKGTKTTLVYKLTNTAKNAKLDRTVVYLNTTSANSLGNQVAYSTTLDPKYKETIQVGSDKFVLSDYQFSRSGISDDRKIIKYLVSNWNGRKVYDRNTSNGQVIVDINSELYRYDNYWSSTETALINNSITYKCKDSSTATTYKEFDGTVDYAVSNSSVKTLEYAGNTPLDISFQGGYIMKESQENIVSYSYDTPKITNWIPTGTRNKGKDSYKLTTLPVQSRLFIPNIKDVSSSYWAAEDIRQSASLDIIGVGSNNYFNPLNFISRAEFTKAIVKAADIPVDTTDKTKLKTYDILFDDVEKNHPYYDYIYTAVKAGIINGDAVRKFAPDEYLTKAEAAAIIVRAMGLEDSSSESSVTTPFADDKDVLLWAKKAVNIAQKMGIITANSDNEIEPNKYLTRAECAVMMNRFIKYLQYDIKQEYREKVIDFGR